MNLHDIDTWIAMNEKENGGNKLVEPSSPKEIVDTDQAKQDNDDDSLSVGSFSTIMSDESEEDSDDEQTEFSQEDELERLHRRFQERNKFLEKITVGKSPGYIHMLRESEDLVQKEALRLARRKRNKRRSNINKKQSSDKNAAKETETPPETARAAPGIDTEKKQGNHQDENPFMKFITDIFSPKQENSNAHDHAQEKTLRTKPSSEPKDSQVSKTKLDPPTPSSLTDNSSSDVATDTEPDDSKIIPPSQVEKLLRSLMFEVDHSLKGYLTFIIVMSAHLSIYQLISVVVTESSRNVANQDQLHYFLLIVSLFLARLTGMLWDYIDIRSYRCVKFDMHNRLRLGYWDARALRWFRRHPTVRDAVSTLSIYLCFISVFYFQSKLMQVVDIRQAVLEGLPSTGSGFVSLVRERLSSNPEVSEAESLWAQRHFSSLCEPGTCSLDDYGYQVTNADEIWLYQKLSRESYSSLMGDAFAGVFSPASELFFHAIFLTFALSFLAYALSYPFAL